MNNLRFNGVMLSVVLHGAGFAYAGLSFSKLPKKGNPGTQIVALFEASGSTQTTAPISATPQVAKLPKRKAAIKHIVTQPVSEPAPSVETGEAALGVSEVGATTAVVSMPPAGAQGPIGASPDGDENALLDEYKRLLYGAIDARKEYPLVAQRARLQGTVYLDLLVDAHGQVMHAEVALSSGYAVLDNAAIQLIYAIEKLPLPPKGLRAAERHVRIPLSYRLS
jgi:periplasmic protein TonB